MKKYYNPDKPGVYNTQLNVFGEPEMLLYVIVTGRGKHFTEEGRLVMETLTGRFETTLRVDPNEDVERIKKAIEAQTIIEVGAWV